jgi:3-oxoacyl-[acyl-carrier protein] reductase
MDTLQNKTALGTGASRGIGRATAMALAEAGAHVLVHYGRSAQEAESLVAAIQTKGGRANAISAGLGTPDGATLLAKQVLSIVGDRLDVLVWSLPKETSLSHMGVFLDLERWRTGSRLIFFAFKTELS